ncbi:tetratricopeptide repeat protein [Roseateles sp. BYS78W]|uniref:Tetratricopeptide repeat protein n=1 Tax=Pelomonas candidula TaxID=3299025 RepID=A0ABW7H8D8_9BURK
MKVILPYLMVSVFAAHALPAAADANTERECGSLEWNYGPYDYRTMTPHQRKLVEAAHFTPSTENLTESATGNFGADIKYTLSVFPNHPRALLAMERLVAKEKSDPPSGAKYTMECFYERALRYKPDDPVPRMLYVSYLIRNNRLEDAHRHLEYVVEKTEESPLTQFNAGMLYFDMKDYDRALIQAHRAIALGSDRRELRDRLASVGRWVEPPPAAPASAASQ